MFLLHLVSKYVTFLTVIRISECSSESSILVPFHNSQCPPNFENDCLDKIQNRLLVNNSSLGSEKEIYEVAGLNKILDGLENTQALVILTEFRGASFSDIKFPVILRRLRLSWIWNDYGYDWEIEMPVYLNEEILRGDIKINLTDTETAQPLQCSKHWIQSKYFSSVLNKSSFAGNSRPWHILVSITIFPHVRLRNVIQPSHFLDNIGSAGNPYNIFPSPVPSTNILVVHPSDRSDRYGLSEFIKLLVETSSLRFRTMFHALFYIATSKEIEKEMSISIQDLNLIQLCRINGQVSINFLHVTNIQISLDGVKNSVQLAATLSLCQASSRLNNLLLYFGSLASKKSKVISSIIELLKSCHNYVEPARKDEDFSEANHVAGGYANVWISIMGNFSFWIHTPSSISKGILCSNGKQLHAERTKTENELEITLEIENIVVATDKSGSLYPAVVTSVYNDLKFFTHWRKGLEQLSFDSLLIAFDKSVWLALSISILGLIVILKQVSGFPRKLSTVDSALIPVKLLLEQGNPFPEYFKTSNKLKCFIGAVSFTGIVLSNAYKNTNMYSLIIPRKAVPYRYLQDLVTDNFTIYTRSVDGTYSVYHGTWANRNKNFRASNLGCHYCEYILPVEFNGGLISGPFSHFSEVYDLHKKVKYAHVQHSNTDWNLLLTASSLLYHSETFLKNIAKLLESNSAMNMFARLYVKRFIEVELNLLFQNLVSRSKVALLLPSYIGYKLKKMVETKGYAIRSLYEGEETYYQGNIAFSLYGLVPHYLVQRAKSAERSGLWKRWQNLFTKKVLLKDERSKQRLKIPGMDGNVLIIFILLLSGLVVSSWFFCAEVCVAQFMPCCGNQYKGDEPIKGNTGDYCNICQTKRIKKCFSPIDTLYLKVYVY